LIYTREDCLQEIVIVNESLEGKALTRNFFRENSNIPESVWSRFFGTFQEFKRAAELAPTQFSNKLNNAVAKHSSLDKLNNFNKEKADWSDRYERPYSKRYQTVLVCSDVHDVNADPFFIRTFLDTAARVQPEKIILNGDIFDMTEFSKYTMDPREYDVIGRIKWVHRFLDALRGVCPETEIDFVEGNHEFRLLRSLSESNPGLQIILSDLHGFTIPKLLGLDQFEINYFARADLKAFNKTDVNSELSKNYVIIKDQVLFHHFPTGKDFGYPGAHGHHHKHLVWNSFSPVFGSYEWHQLGCGHKRQASYTPGEKWSNGFLLAHLDIHSKKTQFEYIDTSHDHVVIGGKFYTRTALEGSGC